MLSATSAVNLDFIAFEKEFCVKMIEFVCKKSETDEITLKQVFPKQNFRSDTRKDKSGNSKNFLAFLINTHIKHLQFQI